MNNKVFRRDEMESQRREAAKNEMENPCLAFVWLRKLHKFVHLFKRFFIRRCVRRFKGVSVRMSLRVCPSVGGCVRGCVRPFSRSSVMKNVYCRSQLGIKGMFK